MKALTSVILTVFATSVVLAGTATGSFEDPISDFVSFTNAIKSQQANQKLYIADGVYDLSPLSDANAPLSVDANGSGKGYGDSLFNLSQNGLELIGKSGDPSKVIIKVENSAYRLCRIGTATAAIRNVTLDGGSALTEHIEMYNYRVGGGVAFSANGMISNCVVRNCRASVRGGAISGLNNLVGRAYDCVFYGNYGMSEAIVACEIPLMKNCIITNNVATPVEGGYSTCATKSCNLYDCLVSDNEGNCCGGARGGSAVNCRFVNNRIANGPYTVNYGNHGGGGAYDVACTNCHFYGNSSYRIGGAICGGTAVNCMIVSNEVRHLTDAAGGGGIYKAKWVENCTIVSNFCRRGGGTAYCTMIINSLIACNSSNSDGGGSYRDVEIWNSTIVSNTAAAGGGLAYPGSVHGCTVGWNFSTGNGGASYQGVFFDSLFVGNASTIYCSGEYNGAGGIYAGSATRCIFRDNTSAVSEAKLLDSCEISDRISCLTNLNCHIHGMSNEVRRVAVGNVRYPEGLVQSNLFMISGCAVMRNCLVTDCCWKALPGNYYNSALISGVGRNAIVDNCTFADNVIYLLYRHYDSNSIVFRNCAFTGNRETPSGSFVDVQGASATMFCFSNCVWNVSRASETRAQGYVDSGNIVLGTGANPRYVGPGSDVPSYTPKRSSPLAKNAGVLVDWMDEDTVDLAGNRLLKEGMPPIGCYQCWVPLTGMILHLR